MSNPILPQFFHLNLEGSCNMLVVKRGVPGFYDMAEKTFDSPQEARWMAQEMNKIYYRMDKITISPEEVQDRMVKGSMFGWEPQQIIKPRTGWDNLWDAIQEA